MQLAASRRLDSGLGLQIRALSFCETTPALVPITEASLSMMCHAWASATLHPSGRTLFGKAVQVNQVHKYQQCLFPYSISHPFKLS